MIMSMSRKKSGFPKSDKGHLKNPSHILDS